MVVNHKFYIGLRDINSKLELTNTGILACLEDVGCMHSEIAGYGLFNREVTRKTWLLLNWKVEVIKRPLYNEVINVETWSRGMDRYYAYRDFRITDKDNNIIIKGTSKWILVDIDKRKPIKISDEVGDAYFPENNSVFEDNTIEKIKIPNDYISVINYKITKNMIDINNHLHNIYYMDIAKEALPDELINTEFNKFEIMYKNEIKDGENVKAFYSKSDDIHYVVIKSEDESIIHSAIKFYN